MHLKDELVSTTSMWTAVVELYAERHVGSTLLTAAAHAAQSLPSNG
jgi:hypothetical protein